MFLAEIPATPDSLPTLQPAPATFLEGVLLFVPMLVTVSYLWIKSQIEIAKAKEEAELEERSKYIEALRAQNEKLIEKLCEEEVHTGNS